MHGLILWKRKKGMTIRYAFQKISDGCNRKPGKI